MKNLFFIFGFMHAVSPIFAQSFIENSAEVYLKQAELHKRNKMADSAVYYFDKAVIEFEQLNNIEGIIHAHNQSAALLTRMDSYEPAKAKLHQSLELASSGLDSNHLLIATTYICLGVISNAEDEYDQALQWHHKSLAIRQMRLGKYHADVATSYGNIGNVYLNSGQYDKSVEAHSMALNIREIIFGTDSPEIIESYWGLANAYKSQTKLAKALDFYEKALENKIAQRGEGHRDLIRYYKKLEEVTMLLGQTTRSEYYKTKAEEIK